jgi:hypothetical protein
LKPAIETTTFSSSNVFVTFDGVEVEDRALLFDNPEGRAAGHMLHCGFASNPPAIFALQIR